jgi:hypothetical protein
MSSMPIHLEVNGPGKLGTTPGTKGRTSSPFVYSSQPRSWKYLRTTAVNRSWIIHRTLCWFVLASRTPCNKLIDLSSKRLGLVGRYSSGATGAMAWKNASYGTSAGCSVFSPLTDPRRPNHAICQVARYVLPTCTMPLNLDFVSFFLDVTSRCSHCSHQRRPILWEP